MEKIIRQNLPLKKPSWQIYYQNFKTTILKMFKELKKDMEKVREMMCEQNGTINRDFKNLKRNSGRSQDGRGIGQGDHFLPYKFIERIIERWANITKQLLIASRGHQAPRKATHYLRKEVGQNIKHKKRDKRARDGDPSWEGSLNKGSFQSPGNPRTGGSGGSFRISEGNLTGRKN